jgi:hypothetical protein
MTLSPLAPMASTSAMITVFCAEMLGDNGNSTITAAATTTSALVASFSSLGSSSRVIPAFSLVMRPRPL